MSFCAYVFIESEFGEEAVAIYDVADVVALSYLFVAGVGCDVEMEGFAFYLYENGLCLNLVAHGSGFKVGTFHEAADSRVGLGKVRSDGEHCGVFHEGYHSRSSKDRKVATADGFGGQVLDYNGFTTML